MWFMTPASVTEMVCWLSRLPSNLWRCARRPYTPSHHPWVHGLKGSFPEINQPSTNWGTPIFRAGKLQMGDLGGPQAPWLWIQKSWRMFRVYHDLGKLQIAPGSVAGRGSLFLRFWKICTKAWESPRYPLISSCYPHKESLKYLVWSLFIHVYPHKMMVYHHVHPFLHLCFIPKMLVLKSSSNFIEFSQKKSHPATGISAMESPVLRGPTAPCTTGGFWTAAVERPAPTPERSRWARRSRRTLRAFWAQRERPATGLAMVRTSWSQEWWLYNRCWWVDDWLMYYRCWWWVNIQ